MLSTDALISGMEPERDDQNNVEFDYEKEFWLAKAPYSEDFASEVLERFGQHKDEWESSPTGDAIWRAYRLYHGLNEGGDSPVVQLYESGESGELISLDINHYRGLVKHQIALVTAQRPAWEPQARTSDSEASKQVSMVRNLMDFDMQSGLQDAFVKQLETSKVCASAFLVSGWDALTGLDGRGWFKTGVLAPWEMAHERCRDYDSECSWWIWREYQSRWDWVARYAKVDPKKAKRIYDTDANDEIFANAFLGFGGSGESMARNSQDRLPVLCLLAKPTQACPMGRLAVVTSGDLVLMDGGSPFGNDVPISRMCSSTFIGTSTPCADSWSLMALCDAYNGIVSSIMTRCDIGAVPNIGLPAGSDFRRSDTTGVNMIDIAPGTQDPHLIDLLGDPGKLVPVLQVLGSDLEKLSGVNSVTRGQPQENISSGSMAALMQSMAVQFNSNDERAWALNMERVGTQRLRIFQAMASEELMISVCGKDEAWTAASFKGADVKDVLKVSLKVANPLSKTVAGRLELAKDLLQQKAISPAEYLRVAETGELHDAFSGTGTHITLVKSENEMLLRGEQPRALWTDNPQLHIREHLELTTKDVRYDPAKLDLVHKHIEEHIKLWEDMSRQAPDRLAAIGCPPLPQAYAVGQSAMAMQTGAMGIPPPNAAPPPTPRPQEQPKTEEPPKGKTGPAPHPPGQEPSISAPKEPSPSKAPNGQPVV